MSVQIPNYSNILNARRQELTTGLFMYRELNPLPSYKQNILTTPEKHKENVLGNPKIKNLIRKVCLENNLSESVVIREFKEILNEIGFEKELTVVRWLGWILIKLFLRGLQGILVNENCIYNLKSTMGNCPVILVPSHRSYLDFTIMSFLCFQYDIKLPAIAAGIDFQRMAVFGKLLRQVGAFYMRRSYGSTQTYYWEIFEEYVNEIVNKGDQPIEFFIEGTRSRTGKSLFPKLGLLTMILKSYIFCEVPDILFVPVNLSYDRVLEEALFAFELLGVPKPKETTKGFFNSLRYLHQNYGDVYVTFSEPLSAHAYFNKKIDRSKHNLKPRQLQEINSDGKKIISDFSLQIIDKQQKNTIITYNNLIATILLDSYSNNYKVNLKNVQSRIDVLQNLLTEFGAKIIPKSLEDVLKIHENLICVKEGNIEVVKSEEKLDYVAKEKLKGHAFLEKTMNYAVPFILLQEYVNPLFYFLINSCFIVVILKEVQNYTYTKEDILREYNFLKSLFFFEFVGIKDDLTIFDDCLNKMINLNIITYDKHFFSLGNDDKLQYLLLKLIEPFLLTYYVTASILNEEKEICERETTKKVQARLEEILINNDAFINPYVLSLNTISNCIFSLSSLGAINRAKVNDSIFCRVNSSILLNFITKLESFSCHLKLFSGIHFKVVNAQAKF